MNPPVLTLAMTTGRGYPEPSRQPHQEGQDNDGLEPQIPYTGLGLYDAEQEAELW